MLRRALLVGLLCVCGCASDQDEDFDLSGQLTIRLDPSTVSPNVDYLVSCDPDVEQRVSLEGSLDRMDDDSFATTTLVVPAGECSVTLTEPDARPGCSLTQRVTIRPDAETAVEFSPICGGSLCLPRGDLTVNVQLSNSQDAISVHTDLAYTLQCEGTGDAFVDHPCNDTADLEGSVDMLGGLHLPTTGPIQAGAWELQFSELPAGPCLISVAARHIVESVRCETTRPVTIERNRNNREEFTIDCTAGPPDTL